LRFPNTEGVAMWYHQKINPSGTSSNSTGATPLEHSEPVNRRFCIGFVFLHDLAALPGNRSQSESGKARLTRMI